MYQQHDTVKNNKELEINAYQGSYLLYDPLSSCQSMLTYLSLYGKLSIVT